jgi:hypothetical protein
MKRRLGKRASSAASWRKTLRQFLHESTRDLQVRRFKSFREAAIDESEIVASLIAPADFGQQAR